MMKLLYGVILVMVAAGQSYGQILFKTAGGENGILSSSSSTANVGYDFSDDEALFNGLYAVSHAIGRQIRMKDGKSVPIDSTLNPATINRSNIKDTVDVLPFHSFNLKLSVPIEKNKSAVVSDKSFSPGVGITFDYMWNKDENRSKSWTNFFRFNYLTSQSTFGKINDKDSVVTVDQTSQTVGLSIGTNWITSPRENKLNLIVAAFIPILYNSNSPLDLKKKNFVTDYTTGVNGIVIKETEAYNGHGYDYWSFNPKIDFAWTPWFTTNGHGTEEGPRIGFMSSFSAMFFAKASTGMDTDPRLNFSIGPSIHPKWSTSNVIATIQAEFLDFTDATGTKSVGDIFGVNFYIGVPLNFK